MLSFADVRFRGRLLTMAQRNEQSQAVNVGFESKNLSEAVDLLRWIVSRCEPTVAPDIPAATRESLMLRAERPFLGGQDHIVYGRLRRN